jgi:PAS domain S-box-containing protein
MPRLIENDYSCVCGGRVGKYSFIKELCGPCIIYNKQDDEYRVDELNGSFERIAGVPSKLLNDKTPYDIYGSEAENYVEAFDSVLSGKQEVSLESTISGRLYYAKISSLSASSILIVYKDVLDEAPVVFDPVNPNNYHFLLNHVSDGVALVSDNNLKYVNEKFLRIFGYNKEDIRSKSLKDLIPKFNSVLIDAVNEVSDENSSVLLEESFVQCLRKNGSYFKASISCRKFKNFNDSQSMLILIKERIPFGGQLSPENVNHSNRMETLGQLAAGVAHDFNNRLSLIMGFAGILRGKFDSDNTLGGFVDKIISASKQAAKLTEQLLMFSRKKATPHSAVDIHNLIGDVVALLEHSIDKRIDVDINLNAEQYIINGEVTQLQNALINLSVNACDAMKNGGHLKISSSNCTLADSIDNEDGMVIDAGKYIIISIADNGSGIPVDTVKHIFEPFFTTKGEGEGTGLGLAAVVASIKQHDGCVHVESTVGEGTEFLIYLPIHESSDSSEGINSEVCSDVIGGKGNILVIDDEDDILTMLLEMLRPLGYMVATCSRASEAIEMFQRSPDNIDLVILDLMMPEMNGTQVFEKLRKIKPDVKVLVSSGHTMGRDARGVLKQGAVGFIKKPFEVPELSKIVSETILNK